MPAQLTTPGKRVRITADLPSVDFALLQYLAEDLGVTMTDVLRRGIRDEKFFKRLRDEGAELLVRSRCGGLSEVTETCQPS